jgi:dTMP kinase
MFLAFEGMDGSGKSTQAKLMAAWLGEQGRDPLLVIDPGSTPMGNELRRLVKDANLAAQPLTQMLMFSAARSELAYKIRQHLDRGGDVVADRWFLSTVVYQGHTQGICLQFINDVHEMSCYEAHPDMYIVCDLDTVQSVRRLQHRPPDLGGCSAPSQRPAISQDRFDDQDLDFKEQLRRHYLQEAENRENAIVVDASYSPEVLHDMIREELQQRLTEFAELASSAE